MKKLCKPTFEKKDHGQGAGIPVLKSIWDLFDLSLLFSQSGIRKHSGTPAWLLAFVYICGMVSNASSANQSAKFSTEAPFLQQLLSGQTITQSAFSRFLSKPFQWLRFSLGRIARLQEHPDSRLTDGDIIALDDTKAEHPHGRKIPFLCWLFDSSDKRHVWCVNLVSTLAVLKNGLEYPMLWRFWVKTGQENEKLTKLDLAKQMLSDVRQLTEARLWVAMDRWFLCKKFLNWLMNHNFDWVTKAKRNTILFRKIYDPVLGKEQYVKLNPKQLRGEVYPRIRVLGGGSIISVPDIYLTSCYAQSETAHLAHVELLFTAKTLPCYATWECNKEGAEQAPSLCAVMRYFFNAGCRIHCYEQLIQVYFDTATWRFSRLIDQFWPKSLELRLWSWDYYPGTA